MRIQSTCIYCEKPFFHKPSRQPKFCSRSCATTVRNMERRGEIRTSLELTCQTCGKAFHLKQSRKDSGRGTFCSRECRWTTAATDEERFWTNVDKKGPLPINHPELGPCWIWTAGYSGDGFGNFYIHKSGGIRTHRWSWINANGPTNGFDVRHKCNNQGCVRPDHLYLKAPSLRGPRVQSHHRNNEQDRVPTLPHSRICEICNSPYTTYVRYSKYCLQCREQLPSCIICGKIVRQRSSKYCSRACSGIARSELFRNRPVKGNCLNCGKGLSKHGRKYCSRSCSAIASNKKKKKRREVRLCNCGAEFVVRFDSSRIYCSLKCAMRCISATSERKAAWFETLRKIWTSKRRSHFQVSAATSEKMAVAAARRIAEGRGAPRKDTLIEKILWKLLEEVAGFEIIRNKQFGRACVDAYIPELHIAFEADGWYWHDRNGRFSNAPEKDARRDANLLEKFNLPVARLTEIELHKIGKEISRETIPYQLSPKIFSQLPGSLLSEHSYE